MNEQETEVFVAACNRLNIISVKAPAIFGVARQTFANWIHGKTKIPHKAFITILEYENRSAARLTERMDFIQETVRKITPKTAADETDSTP